MINGPRPSLHSELARFPTQVARRPILAHCLGLNLDFGTRRETLVPRPITYRTSPYARFTSTEQLRRDPTSTNHHCPWCQKVFASRLGLAQHQLRYCSKGRTARPCSCDACGSTFTSSKGLAMHRRGSCLVLWAKTLGKYKCPTCGHCLKTPAALKEHVTKCAQRPFACDKCHKRFSTAFGLERHHKQYGPETKHHCRECDIYFTRARDLKKHNDTMHSGPQEHICDICGPTHRSPGALYEHRRGCHCRPRLQCSVCDYSAVRKRDLRRHLKLHGLENSAQAGAVRSSRSEDRSP